MPTYQQVPEEPQLVSDSAVGLLSPGRRGLGPPCWELSQELPEFTLNCSFLYSNKWLELE